jgi:hypothetical protein
MEAIFYRKVKNKNLFIYEVKANPSELFDYKSILAQNYRTSEDSKPLFFTKFYSGLKRPLVFFNEKYTIDLKKIRFLENDFINEKQNIWNIIDHCESNDPRLNKVKILWSINKTSNDLFNSDVHKTPLYLKTKLFNVLKEYGILIAEHAKMNEEEANEIIIEWNINEFESSEESAASAGMYDASRNEIDSWSWGDDTVWNND